MEFEDYGQGDGPTDGQVMAWVRWNPKLRERVPRTDRAAAMRRIAKLGAGRPRRRKAGTGAGKVGRRATVLHKETGYCRCAGCRRGRGER